MGYPTWIYHRTEAPKLVDSDEAEAHFKDGWADTPAKFVEEEKEPSAGSTGKGKSKGKGKS